MRAVVIGLMLALLVSAVGITNANAQVGDKAAVMQKIAAAIKIADPDVNNDAVKGATVAIANALDGKEGFVWNENAQVIADTEKGSINTLVCISNSGFPVPGVGFNVWCATFTNDPDVNDVHIKYKTPSGNEVTVLNIPSTPGITTPFAFAFPITMTEAGIWKVKVFYTNNGQLELDLQASWMVLPESAIGAVAIIGAGIASVAVYGLRKKQSL